MEYERYAALEELQGDRRHAGAGAGRLLDEGVLTRVQFVGDMCGNAALTTAHGGLVDCMA